MSRKKQNTLPIFQQYLIYQSLCVWWLLSDLDIYLYDPFVHLCMCLNRTAADAAAAAAATVSFWDADTRRKRRHEPWTRFALASVESLIVAPPSLPPPRNLRNVHITRLISPHFIGTECAMKRPSSPRLRSIRTNQVERSCPIVAATAKWVASRRNQFGQN